ncbi:MAG TPA: sigma 54-interacting transcriptional regulator [Polyangiaceae bacterium]|nr:sigma 54-interacting transcriptional regulator [Polyangiaceae bacterium]
MTPSLPDSSTIQAPGSLAEPGQTVEEAAQSYLLVFAQASSWLVPLLEGCELSVGRAEDCDICLPDHQVSRVHARVRFSEGVASVVDLESHNGTRLNGQLLREPRALVSGDVIEIGRNSLAFHARTGSGEAAVLDFVAFRRRLAEEVVRARTLGGRLAVAALEFEAGALSQGAIESTVLPRLRGIDRAAWLAPAELALLLPEADAEEARASVVSVLEALGSVAGSAALAGVASYPENGGDLDSLLANAREAARAAPRGHVALSTSTPERLCFGPYEILLGEPVMRNLYALLGRLAQATLPVLIRGETGAGKELAAAALHHGSVRRAGPFLSLNCAAISESLADSELFGHRRGAFSGAVADKVGLLEAASGGTLFLDEVGELSLALQAKLLRALELGRLTRVGETTERQITVRLVAATNRDLGRAMREGKFREDLFFRLNGANVWIPPLRDRPREIPVLFAAFSERASQALGRRVPQLSASALEALAAYGWPGNVRQLKNVAEYFASVWPEALPGARPEPPIEASDVRAHLEGVPVFAPAPEPAGTELSSTPARSVVPAPTGALRNLAEELSELETRRMLEALERTRGNQTRAAELLGMPVRTFSSKAKQYGLLRALERPGGQRGGGT